jgi:putative nucleotidyltransferase with HDIG domain
MEKTLEHIRELFPEGELISDVALRDKVYKAWLTAWEMGNSEPPEKISFLPGILPDINNVQHTRAVVALSIQFAKVIKEFLNIPLNMDHIIAGAILHDIGKCFGFSTGPVSAGKLLGHALSAAYVATKEDLPLEVVHIIAAHSAEGELLKRTPEADIIHYMDQAYAEISLRAKTNVNRKEFHKLMDYKKLLRADEKK